MRSFSFAVLVCVCLQPGRARAEDLPVAAGITEPLLDARLGAPSDGIISARHFKEGDFVPSGAVILELDKRLETLEMERRKLVMEQHKEDWESTLKLYSTSKSISKEDLDKKETDYRVATREFEIAQEQVQRRLVTAPFDGVLTDIFHQVGEACEARQTQDPLVRLVDARHCLFVSNVPAKAAARLALQQEVRLQIETGAQPLSVSGKVIFISPVADAASGLVKVKASFENPDGKVRPGLAARLFVE